MKRLSCLLVIALLVFSTALRAQTDTVWTKETAAKWFATMDWFKDNAAPQKKTYDAFGREVDNPSADTARPMIVNTNLRPDPSVNKVEFAKQYHANPSRWQKAFAFLRNTDFSTLQPGRYAIDGTDVYAVVTLGPPRMIDTTLWESHRNFEDIHYVISGKEKIGIVPVAQAKVVKEYNASRDLANYSAKGKYYIAAPGTFFIITTEEAHRPGIRVDGYDTVKKVFIKVRKSLARSSTLF